jgi:predicted nucleotidyltransferase
LLKGILDWPKRNKYQIESAILFGSFAREANRSDSDIDLAIILIHFTLASVKLN